MTFKAYLARVVTRTEPALRVLLAQPRWSRHPRLRSTYQQFARSIFGGKMLRAALVYLGYELAGGRERKKIASVAAAFELMHTALLIHDDLIDHSRLRRGRPSLHLRLGGKETGESLALCYGDVGIVVAIEALARAPFSPPRRQQALEFFLQTIGQTIAGQVLDVTAIWSRRAARAQVREIHAWKTAEYSVVAPLAVGALLAGANSKRIAAIRAFGRHLGIAFQIQDDILGVFGQEEITGKSITSDAQEGKNTLLITHAFHHASARQKTKLRRLYGKKMLRASELSAIKEIFISTGALAASEQMVRRRLQAARRMIPALTSQPTLRRLLEEGVDSIAERRT
jgi:geranylgeranyl pyrophosphate synthase